MSMDGGGAEHVGEFDIENAQEDKDTLPELGLRPDDQQPEPKLTDVSDVLPLSDLEKRVEDLERTLAALTKTPESAAEVDVDKAVELGKATVGNINEAMRPGQCHEVDAQDLKLLLDYVLKVVRSMGVEPIGAAANEVLRDASSLETLRTLAKTDRPPALTGPVDQVAGEITPSDGADRPELDLLVLAGALLLAAAAGAVLPLITASVITEAIFTNEVAIAAITVSVAALMKPS